MDIHRGVIHLSGNSYISECIIPIVAVEGIGSLRVGDVDVQQPIPIIVTYGGSSSQGHYGIIPGMLEGDARAGRHIDETEVSRILWEGKGNEQLED